MRRFCLCAFPVFSRLSKFFFQPWLYNILCHKELLAVQIVIFFEIFVKKEDFIKI